MPPVPPVDCTDATSFPWARYCSCPAALMVHACNCEFSPHTNNVRPRVGLQYCTGVAWMWRVFPQGKKSSVVTSCGHASTGPGDAAIHTGGDFSLAQFAFALPKSAGCVWPSVTEFTAYPMPSFPAAR